MYVCDGSSSKRSSSSARRYFAADLGAVLGVRELDVAAQTGLAEAVSDLEHGAIVAAVSRNRLVARRVTEARRMPTEPAAVSASRTPRIPSRRPRRAVLAPLGRPSVGPSRERARRASQTASSAQQQRDRDRHGGVQELVTCPTSASRRSPRQQRHREQRRRGRTPRRCRDVAGRRYCFL